MESFAEGRPAPKLGEVLIGMSAEDRQIPAHHRVVEVPVEDRLVDHPGNPIGRCDRQQRVRIAQEAERLDPWRRQPPQEDDRDQIGGDPREQPSAMANVRKADRDANEVESRAGHRDIVGR